MSPNFFCKTGKPFSKAVRGKHLNLRPKREKIALQPSIIGHGNTDNQCPVWLCADALLEKFIVDPKSQARGEAEYRLQKWGLVGGGIRVNIGRGMGEGKILFCCFQGENAAEFKGAVGISFHAPSLKIPCLSFENKPCRPNLASGRLFIGGSIGKGHGGMG